VDNAMASPILCSLQHNRASTTMFVVPGLYTLKSKKSYLLTHWLLGMWKGGHKEIPTKLYLVHWTFVNIMIVNTFVVCFVGRDNLAQK
jgi:hypothetical protein